MSRTRGATLLGVDGLAVEVEVRLSSQLPRVDIVGLADSAVRESTARVRAAIASLGVPFPARRVTVNLAPASLPKAGAALDLPIALAVLAAEGHVEASAIAGRAFLGELALDGRLRPVRGALAMVLAVRDAGCSEVIAPVANGAEVAIAASGAVALADGLASVVGHLAGAAPLPRAEPRDAPEEDAGACLRDVRGQDEAKHALLVAAAGGHALLLRGPPGAGKSMLARRLPGLLPPLDADEVVDVARVHGSAGLLEPGRPPPRARPFRAPHHTASAAGLLGGGASPRPGEASLAHRGVLFLDELPEFDRRCLEALRQVLEDGRVVVARARHTCVLPAHFLLVAACNPCPCGWLGHPLRDCRCDAAAIDRYTRRVSGPLLDRIDLHVDVPPVAWSELDAPAARGESSAELRVRVARARSLQRGRGVRSNAELPDARLDAAVDAVPEARALLGRAVERLGLSARAARRVLRVARTVADLETESRVTPSCIARALAYRGVAP